MQCKICKNRKAVALLRHHNLRICDSCYSPWLERRVYSTIKQFKLLSKKDKICVAVSGGKDSLSLWTILVKLGFNAEGLYIHLGIEGGYSDKSLEYVKLTSEKLNKKFYIINVKHELGKSVPEFPSKRGTCSTCGLIKRHFMNTFARDNNFTVLATGHNLDDECATLLGNTFNWELGYLERQSPLLEERDGFVRKVKPLCLCSEKEMLLYAMIEKIEYIEDECPYSSSATSIFLKEILNKVENRMPGTKMRFYKEFIKKKNLMFKGNREELSPCKICGTPTTDEFCAFCKITGALKKFREESVNRSPVELASREGETNPVPEQQNR